METVLPFVLDLLKPHLDVLIAALVGLVIRSREKGSMKRKWEKERQSILKGNGIH